MSELKMLRKAKQELKEILYAKITRTQITVCTVNKGGTFLRCCFGGEYYKIIWFYQLG